MSSGSRSRASGTRWSARSSSEARRSCVGERTTASRSSRPSRRRSRPLAPEIVLDLSDEPIADPPRRFRIASRVLARGIPYAGADFRFDPVRFEPFSRPALAVIGTGKRVGKTAVDGPHRAPALARPLRRRGRDGPWRTAGAGHRRPGARDRRAPRALTCGRPRRLGLSRGRGVRERRHGRKPSRREEGSPGAPFYSNVSAAAELAASLSPDLVVFEGSGAAIPPVEAGKRILVVGAAQDPATVIGYLGAYRVLLSDLVVLTGCEEPLADEDQVQKVRRAIAEVSEVPVLQTIFRPRPVSDVSGRRVAYFSTAPAAAHAASPRAPPPRARRRDRPHLREPLAPARASRRPRLARGALGRALPRRAQGGCDRRRRRDRRRAGSAGRALRQRGAHASTARASTSACSSLPRRSKERARERPPSARVDALPGGGTSAPGGAEQPRAPAARARGRGDREPGSRRWRPRSPIASASRASRPPTSCARRCARSSPQSSCRPSTIRASRPARRCRGWRATSATRT